MGNSAFFAKRYYVGIDAGSTAVSFVLMDGNKNILDTHYALHQGKIKETIENYCNAIHNKDMTVTALTSSTPMTGNSIIVNTQVAYGTAAKEFIPHIRTLIIIGGEKFGVIEFDENGDYSQYRGNTSCAAGTGGFLDQQARRLQLSDSQELSHIALGNNGSIPKIASRCAVFAKTDLIHAQQEGYAIPEICDGLCYGLARNIADTLFASHKPEQPAAVVGGVSLNKAVIKHLESILEVQIIQPELSHLYGAFGAAIWSINNNNNRASEITAALADENKEYHYAPLAIVKSRYPEFAGITSYLHHSKQTVEVDIYRHFPKHTEAFLGIDIGSTSTKMAVVDNRGRMLAGFYTRTAGKPIEAVQSLFDALETYAHDNEIVLAVKGTAATGSGRKFIGTIIGADIILDEITAHAKAAVALQSDVDTIIEIGGQDSKFTMLRNGNVVFSQMNNVCAAGTGSFIEEQAYKLGCTLSDYAVRTLGKQSPIASDRCTVFMERDVNHLLSKGYSSDELLATVLHSVVENYLSKVSGEAKIGDVVCFQGATAKNKALVAAFEQRLQKPIHVSQFCHLTGALGCALEVMETNAGKTTFRGLELSQKDIPLNNEVCGLCMNHCKLKTAKIDEEIVAFGFLCGRDYNNKKYVSKRKGVYDFTRERKKIISVPVNEGNAAIGIPAALHLIDDIDLWIDFFQRLGATVAVSSGCIDPVGMGKRIAQAEFCAPMTAFHGHIDYLADTCDYIFVPFYLEKDAHHEARQQYCYYTQFAPSLAALMPSADKKVITPVLDYELQPFQSRMALYKACKQMGIDANYLEIMMAFEQALSTHKNNVRKLFESGRRFLQTKKGLAVVMLGRTYTVADDTMNKNIPSLFADAGIPVLYQDILPLTENTDEIKDLLKAFHWHFASKILHAAHTIAKTDGLYPVFLTSFKCSPDSFVVEYVKRIMDDAGKPYLILQLDEHDSTVGYETRIEAAVRSFNNHYKQGCHTTKSIAVIPKVSNTLLHGKTVLLPNWDDMAVRLIAANLKREGIDARILQENESLIAKGTQTNTGQCIPLTIIAQECIDYIQKNDLDPAKSMLWMMDSEISCNIRMYPYFIKSILDSHGKGFEKMEVFVGDISFKEVSVKAAIYSYFAFMFSGLLRRVGCSYRPYEITKGATDDAVQNVMTIFEDAMMDKIDWSSALSTMVDVFGAVQIERHPAHKTAIFGDLYVRDNDIMNQNLISFIEKNGGEVITTPYNYYAKMVSNPYFKKWFREGKYGAIVTVKTLLTAVELMEQKYYGYFQKLLNEPHIAYNIDYEKIVSQFGITMYHTGESFDNIIKIFTLLQHYPDISLFVQTSPAFCCPSLITEAMAKRIYEVTGIPIVNITYDGTGSFKNDAIVPYLKLINNKSASREIHEKLS